MFQHTAVRRRLKRTYTKEVQSTFVSTHSRPKTADLMQSVHLIYCKRFNTQPSEDGWLGRILCFLKTAGFQHTAVRRRLTQVAKIWLIRGRSFNTQPSEDGWLVQSFLWIGNTPVSTHSRPKTAEASPKTLAIQSFKSPKSPKSPKKAQSEYSTAFFRHTRFANFLIVKEPSCFANLPAF